jgi:hypothetical protein
MSNRSHNGLLALRLSVETLTQQFEELQRLRYRLRMAETKAICVSRYQASPLRRRRAHSGSPIRYGRRVR